MIINLKSAVMLERGHPAVTIYGEHCGIYNFRHYNFEEDEAGSSQSEELFFTDTLFSP